jgi:hypothetical protein
MILPLKRFLIHLPFSFFNHPGKSPESVKYRAGSQSYEKYGFPELRLVGHPGTRHGSLSPGRPRQGYFKKGNFLPKSTMKL